MRSYDAYFLKTEPVIGAYQHLIIVFAILSTLLRFLLGKEMRVRSDISWHFAGPYRVSADLI
jgi:hypothetical protein